MKVVVLGSTGMIGHKIVEILSKEEKISVINVSRTRLDAETHVIDLRSLDSFCQKLLTWSPDFVINASGILIEDSEQNPIDSILINAILPNRLAELSSRENFRLIQISTDCVFSGNQGPYATDDPTDAHSVYGKTKSLGEIKDNRNLTIRTSVIGPDLRADGTELFSWFMRQKEEVEGYQKAIWSGVTTLELAKCVKHVITVGYLPGLFHLTSDKPISKNDLIKILNEETKKNMVVRSVPGTVTNKSLLNHENFYYKEPQEYRRLISNMLKNISEKNNYPHYDLAN